ncbi:MAG: hypothetical protein KDA25_09825, partial [Phycisphaerales bacterium]|nr:hypothetical protein [Phycisphaerales bacterium]
LPGDLASDAAAGVQSSPRIALGGDRYLAVWTDARAAVLTFDSGDQSSTDIFAARLAADGTLLDAIPLVISHDLGTETDARVAWNGTDWLVAWKGQVPSEFFYQQAVLAVRVSSDGVVLDDEPLVMFTSSSSVNWALTSNGSEWLIVAQGTQAGDGGI